MSENTKPTFRQKAVDLWNYFTTYEKVWFFSILILSFIFAFLFPEEDVNGVNGKIIMALYLLDTFLNILCELLISKQSKWNFIVSIFVELCEIAICLILSYRFATMASTLFFWLPIDIISFVNWHKHPDKQEDDLTKVRKLSGWAEAAVIIGIIVWTVGVGYFLTTLDLGTDLFNGNELLEVIVCYLDACASAVGIANGVFILLRFREQLVHWPEVMVTYDTTDKILFSADAFGTFGAMNGNLFADEVNFERDWLDDARRYYTNIVGKYGPMVQTLLKKAAALDIQMICPLHGPVWRENIGWYVEKYQTWSSYAPEDQAVMIAYGSIY